MPLTQHCPTNLPLKKKISFAMMCFYLHPDLDMLIRDVKTIFLLHLHYGEHAKLTINLQLLAFTIPEI